VVKNNSKQLVIFFYQFLLAIMLTAIFTLPKLNKICTRIASSSILAAIGLMCGLVPQISHRPLSISFTTYAYAQEYTKQEAENYANAGYKVELLRQQIYQEIKTIINEPPPNIVCNQQETLQALNSNVRRMADRYCSESRQIVQNHNLTINRFNQLKTYYDRGDDFYEQVQNILIKIQN